MCHSVPWTGVTNLVSASKSFSSILMQAFTFFSCSKALSSWGQHRHHHYASVSLLIWCPFLVLCVSTDGKLKSTTTLAFTSTFQTLSTKILLNLCSHCCIKVKKLATSTDIIRTLKVIPSVSWFYQSSTGTRLSLTNSPGGYHSYNPAPIIAFSVPCYAPNVTPSIIWLSIFSNVHQFNVPI